LPETTRRLLLDLGRVDDLHVGALTELQKRRHDRGPVDGGAQVIQLVSGVPITNLSGATGDQKYFSISMPSGSTSLNLQMSGGSGDADLYVRYGALPTTTTWDYRPYLLGNNEGVTVSSPTAGTWYVMVRGYATYSGASLVGTRSP